MSSDSSSLPPWPVCATFRPVCLLLCGMGASFRPAVCLWGLFAAVLRLFSVACVLLFGLCAPLWPAAPVSLCLFVACVPLLCGLCAFLWPECHFSACMCVTYRSVCLLLVVCVTLVGQRVYLLASGL